MRKALSILFVSTLSLSAAPALADPVADALAAASTAYAAGDLNTAAAQITAAGKELATMQSGLLLALFPPSPEGWTRTDNTDMVQGLGMMGGGSGAEATYADAEGMTITLTAFADNMMVQSFAGMLGNAQMMAMMGKTVEINGVAFLEQEGMTTMALLENRVLLQASGEAKKAQELLAQIDLAKMGKFDAK